MSEFTMANKQLTIDGRQCGANHAASTQTFLLCFTAMKPDISEDIR